MEEKKGFAGLSSLKSNMDDIIKATKEKKDTDALGKVAQTTERETINTHENNIPVEYNAPKKRWFWWLAAIVMAFVIMIALSDNKTAAEANNNVTTASSIPMEAPNSMREVKPTIGNGLTLSSDEITYCLAERLRLETINKNQDKYSSESLEPYNRYVDDYNSRCSDFRYEKYDMELAQNNVEKHKDEIIEEVKNRFSAYEVVKKSLDKTQSTELQTKSDDNGDNKMPDTSKLSNFEDVQSKVGDTLSAREYAVPPTSSTSGSVPVISDEAMEECVKIYNEAKWLSEKLNNTQVNQYDSASVNNYNNQAIKHSQMINYFNQNCAGKQSYSAWKAAQKLNRR